MGTRIGKGIWTPATTHGGIFMSRTAVYIDLPDFAKLDSKILLV